MKVISAKRSKEQNYRRVPFLSFGETVNVLTDSVFSATHIAAALAAVVKVGKCIDFRCERKRSALLFVDKGTYNTEQLTEEVQALAKAKGTRKHTWTNGTASVVALDPEDTDPHTIVQSEIEKAAPDVVIFLLSAHLYEKLSTLRESEKNAFVFICSYYPVTEVPLYQVMKAAPLPLYALSYKSGANNTEGVVLWDYKLFHLQPYNTPAIAVGVDMYFRLSANSGTPWKMGKGEMTKRCYVWRYSTARGLPIPKGMDKYSKKERYRLTEAAKLGIVAVDWHRGCYSYVSNKINDNILRTLTVKHPKKRKL